MTDTASSRVTDAVSDGASASESLERVQDELPDFSKWKSANPGITLSGYAYQTSSIDQFFSVARILWLDVVFYRNGVFFKEGFSSDVVDKWLEHFQGDMKEAQKMCNHVHVSDLLRSLYDSNPDVWKMAAGVFKAFWQSSLRQQYPDVDIRVTAHSDEDEDYVLSFFIP